MPVLEDGVRRSPSGDHEQRSGRQGWARRDARSGRRTPGMRSAGQHLNAASLGARFKTGGELSADMPPDGTSLRGSLKNLAP